MRAALSRPVLRLLAMGIAERICYGLVAVYYATFLQSTYGLSLDAVALPLGVFAIGNILGTLLGGQLADRLANRLAIFAAAMLTSAVAALALFGWQNDVQTSVALGFGYVFFNAIARPSLMASLSDVPEHVRGTVMGMNVTCNSIGWLGAAALGGWMIGSLRLRRVWSAGRRGRGDRRRARADPPPLTVPVDRPTMPAEFAYRHRNVQCRAVQTNTMLLEKLPAESEKDLTQRLASGERSKDPLRP